MARALPASSSSSIAAHVAGMSQGREFSERGAVPFLRRIGPWICTVLENVGIRQERNQVAFGILTDQLFVRYLIRDNQLPIVVTLEL
jgi:hypothetical protein